MGLLPKKADVRKARERGDEDLANGVVREGVSVLASLTARVGSIEDNKKGGCVHFIHCARKKKLSQAIRWVGYRASKAATN